MILENEPKDGISIPINSPDSATNSGNRTNFKGWNSHSNTKA